MSLFFLLILRRLVLEIVGAYGGITYFVVIWSRGYQEGHGVNQTPV